MFLSAALSRCAGLGVALSFYAQGGFLGYLAAFQYELPVDASQTLVGIVLVGVAEALRRFLLRAS